MIKQTLFKTGTFLGVVGLYAFSSPLKADSFFFSTGSPDGRIATGTRIEGGGLIEVESADDFVLNQLTSIGGASFTGLIPSGVPLSSISAVNVEIYRVFPNDSVVAPSGNVPTRVNSPSDVALDSRESAAGTLSFSAGLLNGSFTAANTVLNGINRLPNNKTGGEGPVTGKEVELNVSFATPFELPADHYFFVPQVELTDGSFLWLSAPKPVSAAEGTPFLPDLQTWIRDGNLDPDWLRIGTDIVGGAPAPTFNASFSLRGTIPDGGSTAGLFALGLCGLGILRRSHGNREIH